MHLTILKILLTWYFIKGTPSSEHVYSWLCDISKNAMLCDVRILHGQTRMYSAKSLSYTNLTENFSIIIVFITII